MATVESTRAPHEIMEGGAVITEVSQGNQLDPYRWQKRYRKKRYEEDAEFKEWSKTRAIDWQRQKYRDDPVWRAKRLERTRAMYHRKKAEGQDPTPETPDPLP